jgi:hypothetical protein
MIGKDYLWVTERVVKLKLATFVILVLESHINATRLSLSKMKRPLSLLVVGNAVSLNVLLSDKSIE